MTAAGVRVAELRVATEDELESRLVEAKTELFNLRFQAATGQLESHGRLRAVRKEIARIYTIMRERELGIVTIEDDLGGAGAEAEAAAEAVSNETAHNDAAEDEDSAEEAGEE